MLHGLGRSGNVWKYVIEESHLAGIKAHYVAYDLLGFGSSPKPLTIDYDVDDHARAVIYSLSKVRSNNEQVILVGHSMGSLVAVRVAFLRPDLIKHLVLYEMPIYSGLPDKLRYKSRIKTYLKFYEWLSSRDLTYQAVERAYKDKLATKITGIKLSPTTLQPFVRSLRNTIMQQNAAAELPLLKMPSDVIYGTRDALVIRGKAEQLFGTDDELVTTHTLKERHIISHKASKFLILRIQEALSR